ncbi:hypothetical protein ACFV6G_19460 [Streptomyces lavendulae]|uniref:hypothetical protein n=1 Tax=Streptomyces lavendulae TaxID=1914 RepID=UPI0036B639C8
MKYNRGDIVSVPAGAENAAVAQIVECLRGNVLIAVFPTLFSSDSAIDVETLSLDDPIFLAETMDLRITEDMWKILGNRDVPPSIPLPEYKVWVSPPGEYRRQDIRGNVGDTLTLKEAADLRLQKSFSPAVVESALRGLHGLGPWHAVFDELAI